ncbi:hypothetical protein EVJ58_g620 [Rhodofomes roseus]|uniref:RING-type domain-containing protein n=1 Tax=Rhodofomes roseus TaxID=34475 RepID=A0A4Y9Z3A5_9APHY|nr:hypothetical protein EVJ58_g620 [Rhodofomes roseus]
MPARAPRESLVQPKNKRLTEDHAVTESEAEDPNPRATKRRKIETPRKPRRVVATQETAVADTSVTRSRRAPRQSDAVEVADDGHDSPVPEPTSKPERRSARRNSTAPHDPGNGAVKELQKSLLQKEMSLKRDRQTLEGETKQLDKREKALQKKELAFERSVLQLEEKTTAVKDREQAARKRELGLKTQETEIEKRTSELRKREQEVSDRAVVAKMIRTEEFLAELEAKWQCALCCDVMAHPYSLSPAGCGHIYCSLCILKWFFTNLCDGCGGWCKILECPLCRTALVKIPGAIPRPMYSLPFTPARAADERITEMIDILRGPVPAGPSKPSGIKGGKEFVFVITDMNVPYIAMFCPRIALQILTTVEDERRCVVWWPVGRN